MIHGSSRESKGSERGLRLRGESDGMRIDIGEVERFGGDVEGMTGNERDEGVSDARLNEDEVSGNEVPGDFRAGGDFFKKDGAFTSDQIEILMAEFVVMIAAAP